MDGAELTTGTVVDRYRIEAVIGIGGMATVYRVRHLALDSVHAMKVLHVASRSIRDRMRQEGQLQAKLSHPNIVSVTDVIDVDPERPGLVMEYVEGPTLEKLLEKGPLPMDLVHEIAMGLFAGVAEAHRHGLVHRDLKPSNVLLKPVGKSYLAKVADFGLAKAAATGDGSRSKTRTGASMGTPHYMSPEQVRDAKNVEPRSDVFALGTVLYEMVTGVRAFEGTDILEVYNAVAAGRYDPISHRVQSVPQRMERAITAALQVNPAARPSSVEALAALWTGTASPLSHPPAYPIAPPPPPAPAPRPRRRSSRLWWLPSLGLLLLLLGSATFAVAGITAWWITSRTPPAPLPPPPPLVVQPAPRFSEPLGPPSPPPAPVKPKEPTLAELGALAASKEPADRRAAIAGLAPRSDAKSFALLEKLLDDADVTVHDAAWRAISERYEKSAGKVWVDVVRRVSGKGTPKDARDATEAMARFETDPQMLLPPLTHDHEWVRAAAVDALPAVVKRAKPPVELGAIRKKLRQERDPTVKKRIAALPDELK